VMGFHIVIEERNANSDKEGEWEAEMKELT
jgi:hypothetical protein